MGWGWEIFFFFGPGLVFKPKLKFERGFGAYQMWKEWSLHNKFHKTKYRMQLRINGELLITDNKQTFTNEKHKQSIISS